MIQQHSLTSETSIFQTWFQFVALIIEIVKRLLANWNFVLTMINAEDVWTHSYEGQLLKLLVAVFIVAN